VAFSPKSEGVEGQTLTQVLVELSE